MQKAEEAKKNATKSKEPAKKSLKEAKVEKAMSLIKEKIDSK